MIPIGILRMGGKVFVHKIMVLTSGSNFTVPSDWNSANNKIHCLSVGGTATASASGASGAYAVKNNVALTPGANQPIQIGAVGGSTGITGTAQTFVGAGYASAIVMAAGASGATAGSVANCIGDIKIAGTAGTSTPGAGGAGAPGPTAPGSAAAATGGSKGGGGEGVVSTEGNGSTSGPGSAGTDEQLWKDNSGGANNGLTFGPGGGGGGTTANLKAAGTGGHGAGGGSGSGSGDTQGHGGTALIVLEWWA